MHLKEAHALFQERHPQFPIGFSTFAKLRPLNVLLLKDTPADQCKCLHHENFMLQLAGLNITYSNEWWQKYLCDPDNLHEKCWKGKCSECGVRRMKEAFEDSDKAKDVSWMKWEKQEGGRLKKVVKVGCRGELEELIWLSLPDFQEHVRVKRIQALSFDDKKRENTVIQMDFAMSYSCEYQHEVQSALWSREAVTLFTAAFFQNGKCESHLIVSNSNDKGKDSVYTYVQYLAKKALSSSTGPITFFTDGPSSELKNRYIAKLLMILAMTHNVPFEWQYFATSHGKGVVDGIGGAAKAAVRRKVMSMKNAPVVQNSEDFARQATILLPKVHITHISQDEILGTVKEGRPWDNVIPVPGISKVHVMRAWPSGTLKLFRTSGVDIPELTVQYKHDK